MKKIISIVLLIIFVFTLVFSMTSCGDDSEEPITPINPDNNNDNIPSWDDPSLNPGGGIQLKPYPIQPEG